VGALRRYWARLENKRLRLAGTSMLVIALLLLLNNPPGSAWNHVGWVFDLIGIGGLVFMVSTKRHLRLLRLGGPHRADVHNLRLAAV